MSGLVVDTSALIAILNREPARLWLQAQLATATSREIAAPNVLELGMVSEGAKQLSQNVGQRLLRDARIEITTCDEAMAERALHAWRRFGKGRHPAGLNFGDCFTYALAAETGYPILCTRNDFTLTDLAALTPQ